MLEERNRGFNMMEKPSDQLYFSCWTEVRLDDTHDRLSGYRWHPKTGRMGASQNSMFSSLYSVRKNSRKTLRPAGFLISLSKD
ncbi:hypothetical protein EYF80_009723 [Liparis tanakae]|uniref:Uncharacterized protein n=1 Tax=Liparis tanakae TaxID=230148 RepID=A0A4Z2IQG0_9TELE|nr:hypothetical protein EYF80_009723 [Liparis tanakae]